MSTRESGSARNRLIVIWAALVGAVLGSAVGYFLFVDRGLPLVSTALVASVTIATLCYLGITAIVALGAAPVRLLFPASDGVVGAPPYLSRVQTLVTRQRHAEATALLEEALRSDPRDHFALLSLADLHARALNDPAASRRFLKRAISSGRLHPSAEALQLRRLAESFLESATPREAAPQLARLADQFPDSAHGTWARSRLQELKSSFA